MNGTTATSVKKNTLDLTVSYLTWQLSQTLLPIFVRNSIFMNPGLTPHLGHLPNFIAPS